MNERIIELADHAKEYANQCTKDLDGDISWHWMDYYTEKFAELIVEECLYIVEGEDDGSADTKSVRLAMIRMKQHFGVIE
jgi:hypothetical protein